MVKVGRPPIFEDPEEMFEAGKAFIEERLQADEPLTITGLAIALGMSRHTLQVYATGERGDPFRDVIKRLKAYVEDWVEQQTHIGKNAAGAIFVLKNLGWSDKREIDQHISGSVSLTQLFDAANGE